MTAHDDATALMEAAFERLDEDDAAAAFKLGRQLETMGYSGGFEIQGLALAAQGRGVEAIEALERGVTEVPTAWLLWQQLGNLRSDAGDYEGALAAYDSAAGQPDAHAASVAYNRAQVLDRAGRAPEALDAIAPFVAAEAELADDELRLLIWSLQIELLNDAGREAEAVAFFERLGLPDADPEHPEAMSRVQGEYALALVSQGRPEDAEAAALKAIAGAKQNEDAQWVLREVRRNGKSKRYLTIMVEGLWFEPLNGPEIPGFYATYHVVADSEAEALTYIREFEPPQVRDSITVIESEAEDIKPQPKGVYFAQPGYSFFSEGDEDDDGESAEDEARGRLTFPGPAPLPSAGGGPFLGSRVTEPLVLRLNPALDPAPFARAYAEQGWVQIPGIFEPAVADALAQMLERGTPWAMALSDADGRDEVLDGAAIQALGREKLGEKVAAVARRAAESFAYCYLCYPMIDARLKGKDPGHPIHDLTDFINSREFLDFGQAVIGAKGITKADAQATFYRPNDFLSLHNDLGGSDQRRAAYTLGFTRRWRPDWGGQLLFHDGAGDVSRGLAPGFNVLTLFKVPVWHSVAPVAPYAAAQRLSVVGWLRDDPPGGRRV